MRPGVRATQHFKRNLLLNLCREGKTYRWFVSSCCSRERKMSGTCSLFPLFGDHWPSCLLHSHYHTGYYKINANFLPCCYSVQKVFFALFYMFIFSLLCLFLLCIYVLFFLKKTSKISFSIIILLTNSVQMKEDAHTILCNYSPQLMGKRKNK